MPVTFCKCVRQSRCDFTDRPTSRSVVPMPILTPTPQISPAARWCVCGKLCPSEFARRAHVAASAGDGRRHGIPPTERTRAGGSAAGLPAICAARSAVAPLRTLSAGVAPAAAAAVTHASWPAAPAWTGSSKCLRWAHIRCEMCISHPTSHISHPTPSGSGKIARCEMQTNFLRLRYANLRFEMCISHLTIQGPLHLTTSVSQK